MNAECRRGQAPRLARRSDGSGHHLRRVGHQRRQQPDGPVFTVRVRDTGDAFGRRVLVEQDAAAAVDLNVDIAGRKQAAAESRTSPSGSRSGERLRQCANLRRPPRGLIDKVFSIKNPRAGQNDHQTVSDDLAQIARAVGIASEPERKRFGQAGRSGGS